jgi:hypothetical protein
MRWVAEATYPSDPDSKTHPSRSARGKDAQYTGKAFKA